MYKHKPKVFHYKLLPVFAVAEHAMEAMTKSVSISLFPVLM